MKMHQAFTALIAAAALQSMPAQAQVSTQELYTVRFRATCRPSDNGNGKAEKMTERTVIQQYVGTGFTSKEIRRNFALVYNPATDSLQVVNTADGSLVSDAFIFQGGTNAVEGNLLTRFAFVFGPNQSDAIGSAVITERARNSNGNGNGKNGNNNRARITGRIQFASQETNTTAATTGQTSGTSSTADNSATMGTNSNSTGGSNSSGTGNTTGIGNNSSTGTSTTGNGTRSITVANDPSNSNGNSTATNSNGNTQGNSGNNTATTGDFVQASAASAAAASSPSVRVCSGTFTAGKLFRPGANNNSNNNNQNNASTGASSPVTTTDNNTNNNNSSTNSVNGTNAASATDTRFIRAAAQAGLLEVQLGTLAAQNSTNQDVIAYGQQLVQDHTQSNAELAQLAAQKGIQLPTTLDTAHQNTYNRLARSQGRQFDRAFSSEAITSHRQSIQLYQSEASRGTDTDVRAYAANNLPVLQEHLTKAQQLQATLK